MKKVIERTGRKNIIRDLKQFSDDEKDRSLFSSVESWLTTSGRVCHLALEGKSFLVCSRQSSIAKLAFKSIT